MPREIPSLSYDLPKNCSRHQKVVQPLDQPPAVDITFFHMTLYLLRIQHRHTQFLSLQEYTIPIEI